MHKNFDEWNIDKKKINNSTDQRHLYKSRDIWWCRLGLNIGFEQDGKNKLFERPVLIIKGLSASTCLIAPITSSPIDHKYRPNIGLVNDNKISRVILSQIKVIDTKRLMRKIGVLDSVIFETIRKTLKDML